MITYREPMRVIRRFQFQGTLYLNIIHLESNQCIHLASTPRALVIRYPGHEFKYEKIQVDNYTLYKKANYISLLLT